METMARTRLCVALLVLLALSYCHAFKDAAGYTCKYYENNRPKKCRELVVNCSLKKKGKPTLTNNCKYSGDPHGCVWYNKKNQPKFYAYLAGQLTNVQGGACNAGSLDGGKHCPSVTFNIGGCR